jgi:benzylsuccinate CoA-transferase BbsF subunit/naphthyl-2-methylsuccinate CoA transferase subunit
VSLAVRSDAEWQRLSAIIAQPWTTDSRFAAAADRREHTTVLDQHIETWTTQHDADTVMTRLQAQGIPAATVCTPWTITDNPQLQARSFFEEITHPDAGTHGYAGIPWKMSRTPGRVRLPPPGLGQHTAEILGGMLGMSTEEIDRLRATGVTGNPPPRK